MGNLLPFLELGGNSRVSQMSLGAYFTCVVMETEDVKCFGSFQSGKLGIPFTENIGDDATEMGEEPSCCSPWFESITVSFSLS